MSITLWLTMTNPAADPQRKRNPVDRSLNQRRFIPLLKMGVSAPGVLRNSLQMERQGR